MNKQEIIDMRNRKERMENEGKLWSEEDRQRLKENYDNGFGLTEIAHSMRRSELAICQQIDKMDLFNSPIKHTPSVKVPKCLCGDCKLCPNACPAGMRCPRLKEEG